MPLFTKLSKKHQSSIPQSFPKRTEIFNGSSVNSNVDGPDLNSIETSPTSIDSTTNVSSTNEVRPSANGFRNSRRCNTSQNSSPRTSLRSPTPPPPPDSVKTIKGGNPMSYASPPPPQDTKLVFQCQLAHGSPTGLLCGFANLRELYERAAECYDTPIDDILFCTLNTHKVNTDHLLGGQIGLNDFIFIHVKGQKKEVEIVKDESSLGVTITDNGAGKAFIKRIRSDSVVGKLGEIVRPGDHFEAINGENMVSRKHFDVAKYLRDLPVGSTFTLRLIEPLKSEIAYSSPRSSVMSSSFLALANANVSGMKTLRFKAKGTKAPAVIDSAPSPATMERINAVLESYLGIHDSDLALTIWDIAKEPLNMNNPVNFLSALRRSELSEFQLPDEVVFDLWAATKEEIFRKSPRRSGRVTSMVMVENNDEKTLTPGMITSKDAELN